MIFASPLSSVQAQVIEDEIIVQFDDTVITPQSGTPLNERIAEDIEIIDAIPDIDLALIKSNDDTSDTDMIVKKLENLPEVKNVEYNQKRVFQHIPNDQLFEYQWAHRNVGQSVNGYRGTAGIDLASETAWNAEPSNLTETIIAVVDAGVAHEHADLADNMWDGSSCVNEDNQTISGGCPYHGWDYEDEDNNPHDSGHSNASFTGHGTFVASQIAAVTGNNQGISGFSRHNTLKVMALKFNFDVFSEIKAIDFSKHNGAKVINASYGGGGYSQIEHDAIANFPGMFITASGNGGSDYVGDNLTNNPFYPCNYNLQNVICVAAMNQDGDVAPFSNYSTTYVDIAAPGTNLLGIYQGSYLYGNGTSFATPLVSAAAGMLYALDPTYTNQNIRSGIISSGNTTTALSSKIAGGKSLDTKKVFEYHGLQITHEHPDNLTPIYRLYNTQSGVHLYTRGIADRNKILSKFPVFEFTDGGPAFYASLTDDGNTPIYRLYNTQSGVHLYTRGIADRNKILSKFPVFEFTDGGPAFYASLTDDGNTPIYRLYNTQSGVHLYTRGIADRNKILSKFPVFEFTDGGPAFYADLTP